jgi:hypothetical protein
MRRRISLKAKLVRIALAYALALQALLGVFAGLAVAGESRSFDPSLSLCRTSASEEPQQSDDHAIPSLHCAVMCLSGACTGGDPPAAAGTALEFPLVRAARFSVAAVDDCCLSRVLRFGLNARGPPSIG